MKVTYDQKLLVAIGKSRMAKHWQNKEILWSELLDKLSTTTRTRETVAEYATMSKEDKNRCKDVGGFVAGYLKNGKRNNASVVNRCAVSLNADYADENAVATLMEGVKANLVVTDPPYNGSYESADGKKIYSLCALLNCNL